MTPWLTLVNIYDRSKTSFVYVFVSRGVFLYAAIDQAGQLIYAQEAFALQSSFHCPVCHQPVILKRSRKGNYFFAHLMQCQSDNPQGRQLKGEGEIHQQGKRLLALSSFNSQLEYWLPTINQQVDCWYHHDPPIILEFQNSVISSHLLLQRHQAYLSITSKIYWVAHLKYWQSHRVSTWQRQLLHYHPDWGYYWLGMDEKKRVLIRYSQLPIIFSPQSWHCQREVISLTSGWLDQFERQIGRPYSFKSKILAQEKVLMIKRAYQQNPAYQVVMHQLHEAGTTIDRLPDWIFQYQWQSFLIETPMWMVLSLVWARMQQAKRPITLSTIHQILIALVNEKKIRLATLPLIQQSPLGDICSALYHCLHFYIRKK